MGIETTTTANNGNLFSFSSLCVIEAVGGGGDNKATVTSG